MNESKTEESELLYSSVFKQIQECGDIVSSLLFIYKFITDNDIPIGFNIHKLRTIALRSADNETSTYLWHINALIAASCDFEHLLLGIEIMFDRFLGNKALFLREKGKQSEQIISTPIQSKSNKSKNKKYIGNEIVSFVKECIGKQENIKNYKEEKHNEKDDDLNEKIQNSQNNIKFNSPQIHYVNDENKEYMNTYRGKISSPISFRMRQQKRLVQNERRVTSRNPAPNASADYDYKYTKKTNIISNDMDDVSIKISSPFEPEILSPFNVSKFAKIVDFKR